jgi:prepilin-type N-terminal cleavage/methylation domain-containing protein
MFKRRRAFCCVPCCARDATSARLCLVAPRLARFQRRRAFTLLEMTVALAILAVLIVIIAQCFSLSFRERARAASHHVATELAANILEAARAQPFDKLDQSWADSQVIPTYSAELLRQGKVIVTVEPEKSTPNLKRVQVEVRWRFEEHLPMNSVHLTTLIAPREARSKGGEP